MRLKFVKYTIKLELSAVKHDSMVLIKFGCCLIFFLFSLWNWYFLKEIKFWLTKWVSMLGVLSAIAIVSILKSSEQFYLDCAIKMCGMKYCELLSNIKDCFGVNWVKLVSFLAIKVWLRAYHWNCRFSFDFFCSVKWLM